MLPVRTAIALAAIQNEINRHLSHGDHAIFIEGTNEEMEMHIDRDGIGIINDDTGEPALRVKFQVIMLPLDGD